MMPAFLFVTGYFAKKSHKPPIVRASKMFIIFIIAQTIITLYYTYVLGIVSPDKNPLIPRYTLWFLLTCGSLYLLEYLIRKFNFKTIFIMIATLIMSAVVAASVSSSEVAYNVSTEDKKVTNIEMYSVTDGRYLNRLYKIDFLYDAEGHITDKKTYVWDKKTEEYMLKQAEKFTK